MGFLSDLGSIAKEMKSIKTEINGMKDDVINSVLEVKTEITDTVNGIKITGTPTQKTDTSVEDEEATE